MTRNEEPHNPKFVTTDLCISRRETLKAELKGLRNQIVLATTFIQIIVGVVTIVLMLSKGGA